MGRRYGGRRPPHALLAGLVLASVALMALDRLASVDPARRAVGEVLGPAESGVATVVRPITALPGWLRTSDDLRDQVADLEAENQRLQAELHTRDYDANRLAAYDELAAAAGDLAREVVPARVVGLGASQSFSDTVTIDAGATDGIAPDQTVLDGDGLVGRVLRVTRTTATVLLITDPDSVVGARVGRSMDVGFLRGRGDLGADGRLDLELVDAAAVPDRDDSVVTWGSRGEGPYVPGIPVGRVTEVYSSLRESTQRVVVAPYADLASLDLVGVVVPDGTDAGRELLAADDPGEQP